MAERDRRSRYRARVTWMADMAFGLESARIAPLCRTVRAADDPDPQPEQPARIAPPRRPDSAIAQTVRPTKAPDSVKVSLVALPPAEPISGRPANTAEKRAILDQLNVASVQCCTKCPLHMHRTQTVFGEGNLDAKIMFIGEGPGENEDLSGRPFVGRAGELLDRMITNGMGLQRSEVYICNIVKCRPPGNRAPIPEETAACTPYLVTQIETIRPKVIVTLGAPAAKYILRNDKLAITRIRGTWHEHRGIRVMPTFHPAYILRQYTPEVRGQVWSDLQSVLRELGLPIPNRTA